MAEAWVVLSSWTTPYSYTGVAPFGSIESDSVWEITRVEIDGSVKVVNNAAWTNRLTEIYV